MIEQSRRPLSNGTSSPHRACIDERHAPMRSLNSLLSPSSRIVLSLICPRNGGYSSHRGSYISVTSMPAHSQPEPAKSSFSCPFWNNCRRFPETPKQLARRVADQARGLFPHWTVGTVGVEQEAYYIVSGLAGMCVVFALVQPSVLIQCSSALPLRALRSIREGRKLSS